MANANVTSSHLQHPFTVPKLQRNSYLGLWGKVFEGAAPAEDQTPPALTQLQRFHSAAREWRNEAAENAQSRLMQRMKSLNLTLHHDLTHWNATEVLANLTGLLPTEKGTDGLPAFLQEIGQRLGGDHVGKFDPAQLVSLAVLQGWALHALSSKMAGGAAATSEVVSTSSTMDDASPTSLFTPETTGYSRGYGSRWNTRAPRDNSSISLFSEVGVLLPDTMEGNFLPEICARLADFGNAPGYNAAWLGGPPCGGSQGSTSGIAWGNEAVFQLDCTSQQPLALLEKTLKCSLGVTSQKKEGNVGGSGALLHHEKTSHVLTGPHLNAIRVRVCNG